MLMTQIGSFVPGEEGRYRHCGSHLYEGGRIDDLASGQSTLFMVENERGGEHFAKTPPPDSCWWLDETGAAHPLSTSEHRVAVIEHISTDGFFGARTLFATHYHEADRALRQRWTM